MKPPETHPETTANWFYHITYQWLQPLLTLGSKRPIEMDDLPPPPPWIQAHSTSRLLAESWEHERRKKKPSLYSALNRVYGRRFWYSGIFLLMGQLTLVAAPVILEKITLLVQESNIAAQKGQEGPSAALGYSLPVILFVMLTMGVFMTQYQFHIAYTTGIQIRTALITNVYQKALVLSANARQEFTTGKVVNLMSTDASRIDICIGYLQMFWTAPIQILVALALLINLLGVAALAGFGVLVISGPFQTYFMNKLIVLRRKATVFTDQRVKMTQDLLQGIRIVKFFAWEERFQQQIFQTREKELYYVRLLMMLRMFIFSLAMTMPVFAAFVSFVIYVAMGHELTAPVVFSSLALLNAVRLPLMFVPMVLAMASDALVSLQRLQQLLLAEELQPMPPITPEEKFAVHVTNGTFVWDMTDTQETKAPKPSFWKRSSKVPSLQSNAVTEDTAIESDPDAVPLEASSNPDGWTLDNINLSVERGSLVVIVGAVGAGKSSLLNAIVGEMKRVRGTVTFGGTIGFCPQTAWIQNATLRDNILFGQEYDEARYRDVIKACALEPDLRILKDGDRTEIGERGVNLSGGQKQRINIARAAYLAPDIVLLDDPMSATDAIVSKHIFEKCIMGLLKDKTKVLITHHLHFARYADQVLVMERGKVVEQGTFNSLMEDKSKFYRLMMEHGGTEEMTDMNKDEVVVEDVDGLPAQPDTVADAVMMTEEKKQGAISAKVYLAYGRAGGGAWLVGSVLLALFVAHASKVITDVWLSWWTAKSFTLSTGQYIGVYAGISGLQGLGFSIYGMAIAITGVLASKNLHNSALDSILRSPIAFFDMTPLGRIINRFSKDVDSLDYILSDSFRMFFNTLSIILGTFILISIVFPYYLVPLVPMMLMYYWFQNYFRSTARELKRLDSISRSPLYAQFSETLSGLATIRAYGAQDRFIHMNEYYMDRNNSAYYPYTSSQRWLAIRLESIANVLALFVTMFAVVARNSVAPGLVGLVITYSLQVTGVMNWCVRQASEVESNSNAVERLDYYSTELEHEAPRIIAATKPPADWPQLGNITVRNLCFAYRPELPLVLKNLDFTIHAGEKIGIVGRTGSGKSSIVMALLRMVEPRQGTIEIDGVDVLRIGLYDLRRKIALIPQDPTLFQGTIRTNLDPLGERTDQELWDAIHRSNLHTFVSELPEQLDAPISEGGDNLSVGQRQLICLGRAMLIRARVIVMDEATASVDMETDAFIQQAIRENFGDCTVITIAHRLNTIMDSSRILVLEQGEVMDFDTPTHLLTKQSGIFFKMVTEAGLAV